MSSDKNFQPYVPASQSPRELTARGLILGSLLGVIFAASSVYLAIKVGMTVSASIPIAVLSIAIFRAFGKTSILENTIVQTTGSAGESLAFGVAAALPALLFLGYDIDLTHAFLVAALGGILGVLMMIPLRQGLIVQEHGNLAYPEGTACADVLIVGEQGGTNARTVVAGFLIGGLYKLGYAGFKLWKEVIGTNLGFYKGGSISAEISPELLGVGYIIGPRIAGVTFAGGVMAYLVLIPAIAFFGGGMDTALVSPSGMLIRDMEPDDVRDHYLLFIGAGAVATGGLISLIRSFPTIVSAFKRGIDTFVASRKGGSDDLPRTERDLPITVVIVGSILLVLAMWLLPPLQVNALSAVLIVIFGFFFVTVSARITGEIGSSSNPISGMVVATLLATCLLFLALGWTTPADRFRALTTAAIVGIAASNGGTTAQDLKTAYLVGGTPYRQQIALFVGVITSALLIGVTLVVLNQGATVNIPEAHPAGNVAEMTDETVTMSTFPVTWTAPHEAAAIQDGLWPAGIDLQLPKADGEPTVARVLDGRTAADLAATRVAPGVTFGQIATLGAGVDQPLTVGYVRDNAAMPAGKYLVAADGSITHVVDPGIGGRITTFRGQELTRYDAPKARLFSLIIDGILTQQLPWDLVLLGVFIAFVLELCGVSSLPFAVGVYLPISTSTPIFIGGMVRWAVDKYRATNEAEAEFSPGVLLSSGYIAGGAIAGVVLAVIAIPGGGRYLGLIDLPARFGGFLATIGASRSADELASNLFGLLVFATLAGYLLYTGVRGQGGASPTAKL